MTFSPSKLVLGIPPLVGTMESAEREFAATLIVRACQVLGDVWRPITIDELQEVLKADVADSHEPIASLFRNPFFRPDFHKLADGTYGRWLGTPGESAIELTERGIEALKRWVLP